MKKIIIASALLLISRVCCAYSIGADLIPKMYYKNISLEKTYEIYKNFFLQEGFVLSKLETRKTAKDKYNPEMKIIDTFFSYKPTKPYFNNPGYGFKLTEIKVKEKGKNCPVRTSVKRRHSEIGVILNKKAIKTTLFDDHFLVKLDYFS